jgi:WD40 repeat protein
MSWKAHSDNIIGLAFSPDECRLATGSWDYTVKLWDLHTGVLLWTGWHIDFVFSVVFSLDGRTLASGGDDATIYFWEVSSGKQIRTLACPGNAVNSMALSSNG